MPAYEQLRLDNQLCFALYAASRAVTRAYAPLLADAGLTYPQYVTLLALWQAHPEPMSVGALGDALHLDSGTLTPLLKRLEVMGHLMRRRDAADERRVLVELTPAGLALRAQLSDVPASLFGALELDLGDAVALKAQLERLTAALEAGDRSGQGTSSTRPKARRDSM